MARHTPNRYTASIQHQVESLQQLDAKFAFQPCRVHLSLTLAVAGWIDGPNLVLCRLSSEKSLAGAKEDPWHKRDQCADLKLMRTHFWRNGFVVMPMSFELGTITLLPKISLRLYFFGTVAENTKGIFFYFGGLLFVFSLKKSIEKRSSAKVHK